MISETCRLSQGERSTGTSGVICGLAMPSEATSSAKPDISRPEAAAIGKRRPIPSARSDRHHATKIIVSYPLPSGRCPAA